MDWKTANLRFVETAENDEVELMACMEHEMWCQEMQKAGWHYGEKRSIELKTNPAILTWNRLPGEEIVKNKNFIRSLPKVLAQAGFQIEKKN